MKFWKCLPLLFWGILGVIQARDFYVAAPSLLKLNSDETVAIAIDGNSAALVNVYVQDYPGRVKNITQTVIEVQAGEPKVFNIRLNAGEFPLNFLTAPGSQKIVALNVRFLGLQKEILIPISGQTGYVFIQTDKPIYKPNESAFIRIIPLTEEVLPSKEVIKLQIRNPDDIIVAEKTFNDMKKLDKAFANHIYQFPNHPVLGEWTATVRYGYNLEHNSTVRFQLEEYVLPMFTVQVTTPEVILESDKHISIDVEAKYVYGEKVKGIVTFRLGVKRQYSHEVVFFSVISPKELDEGHCSLTISTNDLKRHKDIGWFPAIDNSHLVVEATVVDIATRNEEVVTDSRAIFSRSPFVISFKRCLRDFKPGLTSVFEADISYIAGKPASGISTRIRAVADNGKNLIIGENDNTVISDENGKISFEFQAENHHKSIDVTLETEDPYYKGSQARGNLKLHAHAHDSPNKAYLAIARTNPPRLKPGDKFGREVHFEPAGIQNIHYLVMARGKILSMKKLKPGEYKIHRLDFKITHDMVPSFRIVVFAHHKHELIADSLKIEVDRVCDPDAQVHIDLKFGLQEPGSSGKIIVRGTKGTSVGLHAVDEAVYALSKKDLLTETKIFDSLESHDLGCGPGGGNDVNTVLGDAGIIMGTNEFSSSHLHSCTEIKRRKRAAAQEMTNMYSGFEKECCELGTRSDKYDRTCEERMLIVSSNIKDTNSNCSEVFLECCLETSKGRSLGRTIENDFDTLEVLSTEDGWETKKHVRIDFKETMFYENFVIRSDQGHEVDLTLTDSITTWIVQAVSVSPTHGICLAKPKQLVSFKKLFVHLNLPYSVVRNEQIEIQATVFNYGDKPTRVIVYMYGVNGLCSGTQPGERSESKQIEVPAQSAKTVAFPVVPLKVGDFTIRVTALSFAGSDIVEKKLHVIPEGKTEEINIPIKLDPTNKQRRGTREVNYGLYKDHIDSTQNMQVTVVDLPVPDGYVPGTASCSIKALGDMFGPAVETALDDPDRFLQRPGRCGEQNMMKLAPTLYTMRYLKVIGKLTADREENGYEYIRYGYSNQLNYRKEDGSYSAFPHLPTSTWLTAFVVKVFCQASELVYIDENVICSGVRWLIRNQEQDGSYIDRNRSYYASLMGGIHGRTAMTAFALIALEECKCNEENLILAKNRAVAYLESQLTTVDTPMIAAVTAYALALSKSEMRQAANYKLLSMAKLDEGCNWMSWTTDNSAQDIETAAYALLTQLLFDDMGKSTSIVNWLNSQQQQSGAFKSTQDTVIALQALSEYAMRAQSPSLNLVTNITSSNDRSFHEVLKFNKDNAQIMQDVHVDKIGGSLFMNTVGHGTAKISVTLRYNVIRPTEDICKFDITVNIVEVKTVNDPEANREDLLIQKTAEFRHRVQDNRTKALQEKLDEEPPKNNKKENEETVMLIGRDYMRSRRRFKRQNQAENTIYQLNITLCVKYLGNRDAEMSIVDVDIFSGFEPVVAHLQKLVDDPNHLIQRFERSRGGVVFYLQQVPIAENYCFSFPVIRQYLVGSIHRRVIKVYDYYNPDETCTKFYSPESNSPLLRTICEGGVCECAEGGCPPKQNFPEIDKLSDFRERKEKLVNIFCDNYDYVWRGEINEPVKKEGGFFNISFLVKKVIKAGIEKAIDVVDQTRTLLARDNCETAKLIVGKEYLILGKDGQAYKNADGQIWYRYLLDQTSAVQLWFKSSRQRNQLNRILYHVVKDFKECDS